MKEYSKKFLRYKHSGNRLFLSFKIKRKQSKIPHTKIYQSFSLERWEMENFAALHNCTLTNVRTRIVNLRRKRQVDVKKRKANWVLNEYHPFFHQDGR